MSSFGKTYVAKTKEEEEDYIERAIKNSLKQANTAKPKPPVLSDEEKLAKDFRRRNPDYGRQLDSLERSNQ